MYDYEEEQKPLSVEVPTHIEVSLDTVPTAHPYLPRLCARQGYVFMWHTSRDKEPDLYELSQNAKNEKQWFTTKDPNGIELVLVLLHEYDDEVIIGCVKSAGYLTNKSSDYLHTLLKGAWKDLIDIFGHKKIICPNSSYLEYVHLCVNQKRIPHMPYDKKLMIKNKFRKAGYYWIRDGLNNKTN
jgi:hypothetical protein